MVHDFCNIFHRLIGFTIVLKTILASWWFWSCLVHEMQPMSRYLFEIVLVTVNLIFHRNIPWATHRKHQSAQLFSSDVTYDMFLSLLGWMHTWNTGLYHTDSTQLSQSIHKFARIGISAFEKYQIIISIKLNCWRKPLVPQHTILNCNSILPLLIYYQQIL